MWTYGGRLVALAVVLLLPLYAALAEVGVKLGPDQDLPRQYASFYKTASSLDGRRFAFVLGNSDYKNVTALPNPAHDAEAIAAHLKEMKFDVTKVINGRREDILAGLREFVRKSNDAEVVLFYYAGHAMQLNGVNYIFPTDAGLAKNESEAALESISVDQILSIFETTYSIRILILDACRNNPFENLKSRSTRGLTPKSTGLDQSPSPPGQQAARADEFAKSRPGLARMNAKPGTYLSYSAEPGSIALDGDGSNSPFVSAVLNHLGTPGATIDQVFQKVRLEVYVNTNGQQLPWSSSSLLGDFFFKPSLESPLLAKPAAQPSKNTIEVASVALQDLLRGKSFTVNKGHPATLDGNKIIFNNEDDYLDTLRRGVNELRVDNREVPVWFEKQRMDLLGQPYKKSYALIVAIGNYPDELSSILPSMPIMVENAKRLAKVLEGVGFPRENITILPNANATAANVERELKRFWKGGDRADADRVFVYFGGHGSHIEIESFGSQIKGRTTTKGFLVTYDYDPAKPTASTLLFDDIQQKHFAMMVPRQVLFVIDSCSSGLALPQFAAENDATADSLLRFQQFAILSAEINNPARAIMVASTGDEKALYLNGGVMTEAVIDAFETRAGDLNKDGLIQFAELDIYVSNEVKIRSKRKGFDQDPKSFRVGSNMVFVLPPP